MNSKKVSVTAAERAALGNVVGTLGRDLISHTLLGHSPFWPWQESGFHCRCVKKSQGGFEMGKLFLCEEQSGCDGQERGKKGTQGQLEGAPVFQVRGDGALDQGNSSGIVHGAGRRRR